MLRPKSNQLLSKDDVSEKSDLRRVTLDAARELLVASGFENLSMRRIASATGYSATSIYLHFDNKDLLIHALIEEGFELLYDSVVASGSETHSAHERLRRYLQDYVDFALEHPAYYQIMFQLSPDRILRYPVEKFRRAKASLDLLHDLLIEGQSNGEFVETDARIAANVLWANVHGAASLLLAQRIDILIEAEDFVTQVIELALRSVASSTKPIVGGVHSNSPNVKNPIL